MIIKVLGHAALPAGTARSNAQIAEIVRLVLHEHWHGDLPTTATVSDGTGRQERKRKNGILIEELLRSGWMANKSVTWLLRE